MRILSAVVLVTTFGAYYCQAPPSLYPRQSEKRSVDSLDGIWDFALLNSPTKGYPGRLRDISDNVIPMPVPSSYNDIYEDPAIRNHVGEVAYERTFFVSFFWLTDWRIWLRFGSVCYSAKVYVNGILAVEHEIGHLPFSADITDLIYYTKENNIMVVVNNTLTPNTIPQGKVVETTVGNTTKLYQTYTFDFFNYAGIDRSVFLYTTTPSYIRDVSISTSLSEDLSVGTVSYTIDYYKKGVDEVDCEVIITYGNGSEISGGDPIPSYDCQGTITIKNPILWWPYLMNDNPGFLYTFQVILNTNIGQDIYNETFGFRSLTWDSTNFFINGKPIYIRGFGRHEDSDIRGKGLDLPLIVKDHSLIKWIGANAYRTSHYPYAEEIMDMADKLGIMIIDECPGVNAETFNDELLNNHKISLTELIQRDKNRPSVIMWSIANEPRNAVPEAGPYFKSLADHVRSMDSTRPVTLASDTEFDTDQAAVSLDILMVNRYYSWYSDAGKIELVYDQLVENMRAWRNKHNKPVLISEYGADTIPGLHVLPEFVWSEEYQTSMMQEYFKAFDTLRNEGGFIGEMIWNFADFMTEQNIQRAHGNKKGLFTRQRQPKASAFLMRKRYWELAQQDYGAKMPQDLYEYVSVASAKHSEL